MDIKTINSDLSVTGQVHADDMGAIHAAGFRALICNRPDGEEPGQPDWAEVQAAAAAAGLETRFIPVASPEQIGANAGAFATALEELPGPVLAFCRTGNRSAMLHQAATG